MLKNLFRKKPVEKTGTAYEPLPYWVTGPVINTSVWQQIQPAGKGPVESNKYNLLDRLMAGNPAVYRVIK